MKVLVLNCGSSSIKYQVFDKSSWHKLASGLVERIGESNSEVTHKLYNSEGKPDEQEAKVLIADHQQGVKLIAKYLTESKVVRDETELIGIGHRVAHGGAEFHQPTRLSKEILNKIRDQSSLAPLHNPANVLGIEMTMEQWPKVPQVAIFDTAFHQTMPEYAYRYALPASFALEHRIRRYGFHGTSHKFVAQATADFLGKPLGTLNMIVLHLGNGASATAIEQGQSIDTSMGLTPLEGLMMGTRGGDLDPGVVLHLVQNLKLPADEISTLLNKQSGLKGISGFNDMREVLQEAENGDTQAELALQMYTYRIKKYIGAYFAILPDLNALVFTAGIGEHSPEVRSRVCKNLKHLEMTIDENKNRQVDDEPRSISQESSKVPILVIPTNEELEMARQTIVCLEASNLIR